MNLQFLPNEIITFIQDFVYPKINKIPKDDTRYVMLTMLLASDREIMYMVSGFGPGYKRYTRFIRIGYIYIISGLDDFITPASAYNPLFDDEDDENDEYQRIHPFLTSNNPPYSINDEFSILTEDDTFQIMPSTLLYNIEQIQFWINILSYNNILKSITRPLDKHLLHPLSSVKNIHKSKNKINNLYNNRKRYLRL